VYFRIGLPPFVPAGFLRHVDPLALPFAPVFIVVAGHLQGEA
jgi:hypothetical protein